MFTPVMHPRQREAPAGERPAITICVVDDSPTIRAIVQMTLRSLGYAVHAFADGPELWQWLHRQQILPALFLLDIELPNIDGYDLTRRIRMCPRYQAIPLIMLSSRDSTTARLKARVAGAQAYLTKPFVVQQLQAIIWQVLAPGTSQAVPVVGTVRETR